MRTVKIQRPMLLGSGIVFLIFIASGCGKNALQPLISMSKNQEFSDKCSEDPCKQYEERNCENQDEGYRVEYGCNDLKIQCDTCGMKLEQLLEDWGKNKCNEDPIKCGIIPIADTRSFRGVPVIGPECIPRVCISPFELLSSISASLPNRVNIDIITPCNEYTLNRKTSHKGLQKMLQCVNDGVTISSGDIRVRYAPGEWQ